MEICVIRGEISSSNLADVQSANQIYGLSVHSGLVLPPSIHNRNHFPSIVIFIHRENVYARVTQFVVEIKLIRHPNHRQGAVYLVGVAQNALFDCGCTWNRIYCLKKFVNWRLYQVTHNPFFQIGRASCRERVYCVV